MALIVYLILRGGGLIGVFLLKKRMEQNKLLFHLILNVLVSSVFFEANIPDILILLFFGHGVVLKQPKHFYFF